MYRTKSPPICRTVVSLGLALVCAGLARADFNPLPITTESYNYDVVVEKGAAVPVIPGGYSTASMDGGINNNSTTWNEKGYFTANPDVGLPPAGTLWTSVSQADHQYQFAPSYTANNAIMVDGSYFTNVYTWTLATPRACAALSFLTSGGNGGCTFQYTVHYQEGTTESGTTSSPDWWNGANAVLLSNGRVDAQTFTLNNLNENGNPRLYAKDVTLSGNLSPITSIDIKYVSSAAGAHSCLMAISGANAAGGAFSPLPGNGYNADIVVEASAPKTTDISANSVVTATMDSGTSLKYNTWYEQGLIASAPATGLPPAGSTLTATNAPDHRFVMPASYTANNAVYLDPTVPNCTINLSAPAAASGLSFLTASGNGPVDIQADIHHDDGTTETKTVASPDWFGGSAVALTANGRIDVGSSIINNLDSGQPRLDYVDVALDNASSPVTSIYLTYTSTGGRAVIFAVSGTAGSVRPSFLVQPQTTGVSPGANVTLTGIASGTPPVSYQWQKGTNGLFINIGATSVDHTNLVLNSVGPNDWADYRVVASNTAASATSSVATVTVLSTLPVITQPTDPIVAYQPQGGGSPGAEGVVHAIDSSTLKYLNSGNGVTPLTVPVGFVVTPSMGPSVLTVVRFYTANDAPERDPANYIIEGSNDGGNTFALIASNSLALPDGRNQAGLPLDASTQYMAQVTFPNSTPYTVYRVYFTRIKGNANLMQIGEVELLGLADTSGQPYFSQTPAGTAAYDGSSVSLSAFGLGNPTPTVRWLKGTNGFYVPLTDSGNISGSQTENLTINPASFGDIGDYVAVASNSRASVTSAVAHVEILLNLPNVLSPVDTVASFGDASEGFWANAGNTTNLVDGNLNKYQNGGHGFSANAGFPPFVGPVGVVITPAAGPTLVEALRFFTADGNVERDPVDFSLEGSSDSGATWSPVASGALALPQDRNATIAPVDPLANVLKEVRFNNGLAFTSYRLTFNHTRDDSAANSLQLAEVQMPGITVTSPSTPTSVSFANGNLTLTSAMGGTLQSTSDLSNPVWTDVRTVAPGVPVTIPVSGSAPKAFYRIKAQ